MGQAPASAQDGRAAPERRRKPRVLLIMPALMPSVVIGALRPLSALEADGELLLRPRKSSDWREADLAWADVVVFYRCQEREDLELLYAARQAGKGVIYEIDDNFFEISLGLPLGRWHRNPTRLHALKRFLQMASLVRVYSETLRDQAEKFGAPVALIRSYFDRDLIRGARPKAHKPGAPVKIAYATGRAPDPSLERAMMSALEQTARTFGDKVEITFWRKPPPSLKGHPAIRVLRPTPNYDRFVRSFYIEGFDIGLAPVADTPFYNSKTNNKYREYGGCGVAGVYSNVRLYRACVTDGQNGVLADNTPESWTQSLHRLVTAPELRASIARRAQEDVFAAYSFENAIADWRTHLGQVLARQPMRVGA